MNEPKTAVALVVITVVVVLLDVVWKRIRGRTRAADGDRGR
ncbi:hypothetical protein [Microbacterium terregens]